MHHAESQRFGQVVRLPHSLLVALAVVSLGTAKVQGQSPQILPANPGHQLLRADVPPGVLGAAGRNGPARNYYQPVRIVAPEGASVAMAIPGGFDDSKPESLDAGLLVGAVYRFKVSNIPYQPGLEVFPTLEIIDRTYPPQGLATRFPIPVHLDEVDLNHALAGRLVTRVIYLEDPQTALPLADAPDTQRTVDIRPHQDPLHEADRLGRPVAILRIGSRVPPSQPDQLQAFLLGSAPWMPLLQPSGEPSGESVQAP